MCRGDRGGRCLAGRGQKGRRSVPSANVELSILAIVMEGIDCSTNNNAITTSPSLPRSPSLPQDFLVDLDFRTAFCLHVLHAVPLHRRLPRAGLLPARHGGDQVGDLDIDPYIDLPFSRLPRAGLLPCRHGGDQVGDINLDPYIDLPLPSGKGTSSEADQVLFLAARPWLPHPPPGTGF